VVLALPEDMLTEVCEPAPIPPSASFEVDPGPEQMRCGRGGTGWAQRPLLILAAAVVELDSWQQVQAFAEANDPPVVATFRRQDRFDNAHRCYGRRSRRRRQSAAARTRQQRIC
jgi:acetolactate synthase-1/2/3 large subunit